MTFQYQTQGTCSRAIHIELDGDIIRSVSFDGGCNGNLKAISKLVEGKDIEDAIAHYYKTSQQVEAHCAVLTFGKTYCCLLVEQFPITCEAEEVFRHAADREWEHLQPFITATELTDEALKIFEKYRKVADTPLRFGCTCNRRSVRAALSAVDKEELKNAADEDGFVSVNCKYCGKHYRINVSED